MELSMQKRVSGGSGWADAIFRSSADRKSYAIEIISRVLRRCNFEEDRMEIYFSETGFAISSENRILVTMSFDLVEQYRNTGVFSFEEWLEKKFKLIILE